LKQNNRKETGEGNTGFINSSTVVKPLLSQTRALNGGTGGQISNLEGLSDKGVSIEKMCTVSQR
jgi:hypothetical protein